MIYHITDPTYAVWDKDSSSDYTGVSNSPGHGSPSVPNDSDEVGLAMEKKYLGMPLSFIEKGITSDEFIDMAKLEGAGSKHDRRWKDMDTCLYVQSRLWEIEHD